MNDLKHGTRETKEFYDRKGWLRENGELVDRRMFGWTEGPIRAKLDARRIDRILQLIDGTELNVAELGCGGTPAVFLARRCARYTAVDFSPVGLSEAREALEREGIPAQTVETDITNLPFPDNWFDAVYSAHAIYHIDTSDGQAAAFSEAMRVLRPGGTAIFVLANPFPLLFPYRSLRRVVAMTPVIGPLVNRLRPRPPLPYLPMPVGWMRKQLAKWGQVSITGYAIPSVAFDRHVSETTLFGRALWQCIKWIETRHVRFAAYLGCYVLIVVSKAPASGGGDLDDS